MCGRYTHEYTWRELHAMYTGTKLVTPDADPEPAYNVAPTQLQWVVVPTDAGEAAAVEMRWGLLPAWAKDTKMAYSTINARLESIAEKPSFRGAWKAGRRCLVLASGYYEWPEKEQTKQRKQPYYIHLPETKVMVFGGIWERRGDLETYSIVTKDPDPVVAGLHDRMPLILLPSMWTDWLTGSTDDAMGIAMTAPEPPLAFHKVDPAVGNVRNQGPQLIEPIAA